jgi:8-oxo-dGTP diphosphatase
MGKESDKKTYVINVEGVIYNEGRYLMIVRGAQETQDPLALAMPGGKVEVDGNLQDVLEETVRREILEETGIEICDEVHYLESKSFIMNSGHPVIDVVLLCKYKAGTPLITDRHEVEDIQWLTAEEIFANPKAQQWTCQSIRKAEKFLNGNQ